MNGCLFCEKPGNLVINPDEEAYHAIKNAVDERQDATRDKFYFLYNDSLSRQCFSWHVKCATSYVCFIDNKRKERPHFVPKTEIKIEPDDDVKVKIEGASELKEVPLYKRKSTEEIARCFICNKQLDLVYAKPQHSFKSRLLAAKTIYDTAHMKHDGVFIKIRRYHSPADMIDKGIYYHKACYVNYVGQPDRPEKRIGKISEKEMYKGLKKLLDEIDDMLPTTCFRLAFLARRLAKLTDVKDAVVDEETVKSLLIAKYGDRLLFSYPAGLDSCVLFLSHVPLSEAMKRLS